MERTLSYFVSDVHLGLEVEDPAGREGRFVEFLRGIDPAKTEALYLLGDIWDFWYEYRDVVPKGFVRVFGALASLMDAGVKVYFFKGNHDLWAYRYFSELGIELLRQPSFVSIGSKKFCLGHGDGLGPGNRWYKFMKACFTNGVLQTLFSTLHPWFAFRLGKGWSHRSRLAKHIGYEFKGEEEPLYVFCKSVPGCDYYIFGHYHCRVDMPVADGRLLVLNDWIRSSNWIEYDCAAEEIRVIYR